MRFTLRDLFWLTLLVAFSICWAMDRDRIRTTIQQHQSAATAWTLKDQQREKDLAALRGKNAALSRALTKALNQQVSK